ncbi:hypothetical protein, partial [Candidatus Thiosymbion oneisti]|uniref:hypothetical protein n=2 Tax=Candidatus Thiosymbion oneisti TaxID=589554 RepID=UPI001AACCB47
SDHIGPIYESMEVIHKDYLKAANDLQWMSEIGADIDRLDKEIKERKIELEALRVTIDAWTKIEKENQKHPEWALSFFQECIDYFRIQSDDLAHGYSSHYTDMLKKATERPIMATDFMLLQVQLRERWQYVAESYAQCKSHLLQ